MRRLVLIGLLFALFPLATLAGSTPAGPNVQVTDSGLGRLDDATQPDLAVQNNLLYATWLDTRQGSTTSQTIYVARSDDGGASWSANRRVSSLDFLGFADRPVISAAPDGSIWIAWWLGRCSEFDGECGGQDRQNDTMLALSTDSGQTFGEYIALDGNDSGDRVDGFVEIHAENDYTLLLTFNPAGDGADVLVRRIQRTGPGTLTAATVRVSDGIGNGRITDSIIPDGPRMSMAMRGQTVCTAWEDRRNRFSIFGACSTNGGQSFGANFPVAGSDDVNPRLAFGPDGALYAAYQDVENGPVIVRRSVDNGATWDTPNQAFGLASGLAIGSYDLDVSASGQLLLTVPISDDRGFGSAGDIYLATSVDRGQRFTLGPALEDGQGEFPTVSTPAHPRTALIAGPAGLRAVVVWSDDRNTQDQIWSARVDLDGTPPSAPANLRASPGDTTVRLSWEPATDQSGIAGYRVLRGTSAGGPFAQITPQLVTTTSYRDVGLDTTTYFYKVFAVDGTGNPGPESAVASAAASVGSGLDGLNGTIAYNLDANLALRAIAGGALGEQRVLGEGRDPVFSLDGQHVLGIISADGNSAVISRGLDGGAQQTVYQRPENDRGLLSSVDVTADPARIGVVAQKLIAQTSGVCLAFAPQLLNTQGVQLLYESSFAIATDMSLSSDGVLLAYTYEAWCNAVASGVYDTPRLCIAVTAAVDPRQERCLDGADADDSDFVPGRAQIVFAAAFSGQRELWRADVAPDGGLGNLTQLTRGPAGQPSTAPQVSTDGNWVIFERDSDPGTGARPVLHVVRLDGEGLRSLNVQASSPGWAGGGSPPDLGSFNNRVALPLIRR